MFEQYDAEPAFDYYPPTPSSSASLFTRPSSTLTSKRSFEAGLPLDRAAASPIGSPAAWGQPHPHGSTSGGSFSFASFSGLAEQLFGGCGGGDGEDLASSFDGAVERKASASYPMAAELSAFSNSTIPTTSSSVDGYESYDSAFASSSAGSWGAASPSPYFAPIDLPAEDEPLSYVYDGPSSSVAFYDDNDDADAFGYPSSSSTSAYALALAPVPSVDDVPEWYDPSSSSTLSTKSSFDSFVSASSPLSGDRWDYYDFETDLANGSGSRAVDGSWGFAGPPQPRIAEGGGSDDDEVGSGFEQWVVPHQLHLPYDKLQPLSSSPSSSSTTITPTAPLTAIAPAAVDDRDATRALLRKQASDRALARKRSAGDLSSTAGFASLVGWTPALSQMPVPTPVPTPVARKAPPLRRKAGASSLKASFQALAFASASNPLQSAAEPVGPPPALPVVNTVLPEHYYGLQPIGGDDLARSPFSPPAPHSHPVRLAPVLPTPSATTSAAAAAAVPAPAAIVCSPMEPSYPCTPPSVHPYATSPPAAPRAIRKLPRPSTTAAKPIYHVPSSSSSSSSSCSSSSEAASPMSPRPMAAAPAVKPTAKRAKPLFGSTFINFTMDDAYELLSGVAPSGNLKKPVVSRNSKASNGGGKRKRLEDEAVEHRGGKRTR